MKRPGRIVVEEMELVAAFSKGGKQELSTVVHPRR
jgi:hypothetical protein